MAPRFFSQLAITSDTIELEGTEQHHMAHVMRLKVGDDVTLFDGSGHEFQATITVMGRKQAKLAIIAKDLVDRELPYALTLGVALPKGDRQQMLVEKAVELGVTEFVPLVTRRGVAQPRESALNRLEKAVVVASKQCGRNRLMKIEQPESLDQFLLRSSNSRTMFAHPDPASSSLQQWLASVSANASAWAIAVGPEGGFDPTELDAARNSAAAVVHLGPRILRIETAAIASVAALVHSNSMVET